MKNNKKVFILTEGILGFLVLILAVVMLLDKSGKEPYKVSVIIENSEDNQWAAFRYGLKMAAADHQLEISVVPTEESMTLEEEENLIQQEISNGADGMIIQPVLERDTEEMLKSIEKKVPVMLVETGISTEKPGIFPVAQPDNRGLGKALGEELIRDCADNLRGKTLGIVSRRQNSQATLEREEGLADALKGSGARTLWNVEGIFDEEGEDSLETMPKVDFVIALDDKSTTAAGEYSAANDLHGAIVYGIGTSTEAVYYLDTGKVQCLAVPDEFNVGYQSLKEMSQKLGHYFGKMESRQTAYTVIRRNTLFTKENQEILFTMSQ